MSAEFRVQRSEEWEVTNGEKVFRCHDEGNAKWLAERLNLADEVQRIVSNTHYLEMESIGFGVSGLFD